MKRSSDRTRHARVVLWAALTLALAPFGGRSAGAQATGDDVFLIETAVSPNVVLLMDNSDEMNHIEWHPAFDPEAGSYGCSDFTNSTVYTYTGSDVVETHCGNDRTIFIPRKTEGTYWDGRYLNWYFSDAADPYISEIENDVASIEGCTTRPGSPSLEFANKYRRTLFEASKQVLLDLLCLAEPKNVRFGLAQFRENADAGGVDPNGGYLSSDLGRSNPNHASELESAVKNSGTVQEAPLAETLFQIYSYWMARDTADIPVGEDGITKFPVYVYDKKGLVETNSSKYLEDTLAFDCEKAFVVIVSAGQPTRDDFDEDPADTSAGFADIMSLIGDYHDDGNDSVADDETPGDADESSWLLDDIAKYMNEHDFRPDLGGDAQTIDTYTVALAPEGTTADYLRQTAELGGGVYYEAKDGDELAIALIRALNDIIEKAASFTAAAVPSARTIDGGDFYQSYLFPQDNSAAWEGHVRAWRIEQDGDIVDSNGDCALVDPDSGACPGPSCECNSGPFSETAVYFWDAHEETPASASRTLYVSKLVSGTPTRVAFDDSLTAADLTISAFTAAPDPAPNDALYPTAGSTALTAEGLADEVVAFARGCFFGSGVTDGSLVATPLACVDRPSRLGDIFHSSPVVVRQPNRFSLEESYSAFKTAYATRPRMIYAGTNGGFLEAIHAGDWDASALPHPKYDPGTGVERFGFMPWASRQKIKNYPIDDPSARSHYVDGSPQVADVWIHPSATATTKNADGREWRTMLATGLRKGGRHVLGLDITNPGGIVGPGGVNLEYPGFQANGPAYGWEFPKEGDATWPPHMGQSWSQPIITRVRVSVDNDGVAHERWVAIFAGGYDANGDPNPNDVSGLVSTYDSNATEGRAIFMVEMKTGQVLARKILDGSASDAQTQMLFAKPSTPAVFDLNADGFADVVYVGDLGGQMFKWVIQPLGGDPINGTAAGDDVDQPSWPFVLFFQAPIPSIGGKDYFQNFYSPPAGALVHGDVWIAWGAGERQSVQFEGIGGTTDENNRLYVVRDADPYELAGLGTLDEGDLVDATNFPGGVSNTNGFYIRGADGEKFVTNTVIFANLVITNSFVATPNADPCQARGLAKAYVFDLLTGEGFFVDVNGDPERTLDLGVGLPTDPKVSVNVGGGGGGGGPGPGPCGTGQGNRVYIEKSGGGLESFETCDVPTGGQVLYWREVQ
ncbi:MAG: PilC/PilY family type IV pilus protein [Myxococcales bacterium]|nr:PilC/PilY family type IV pilus protein [Myxococcales bacterium]